MKRWIVLGLLLVLLLVGCQKQTPGVEESPSAGVGSGEMGGGMGSGMGASSGMRDRHHALIPDPYAGVRNDIVSDEASVQRGSEIFATHCVNCHGEDGMGTGPAAGGLDPAPAPIAHTSQMMGDSYLLWRISEGGAPFQTQMPAWKDVLDQDQIWDVVNYIKALGAGTIEGRPGLGRQNADIQAAQHAEMLANAIEQGIIDQSEADTFELVHDALDVYMEANPPEDGGGVDDHRDLALAALIEAGTLTQEQVDVFNTVHDRLEESGLMQ